MKRRQSLTNSINSSTHSELDVVNPLKLERKENQEETNKPTKDQNDANAKLPIAAEIFET